MEVIEMLRSRILWGLIAVVSVAVGIMALAWPALALLLLVGVFILGALAAAVYAVVELGLLARRSRRSAPQDAAPEIRITRVSESEPAATPTDRR